MRKTRPAGPAPGCGHESSPHRRQGMYWVIFCGKICGVRTAPHKSSPDALPIGFLPIRLKFCYEKFLAACVGHPLSGVPAQAGKPVQAQAKACGSRNSRLSATRYKYLKIPNLPGVPVCLAGWNAALPVSPRPPPGPGLLFWPDRGRRRSLGSGHRQIRLPLVEPPHSS